jgi:hypothetical protein
MKLNNIPVFALAIGLLGVGRPKQPTNDAEKLKQVLTGYFEGIETKDTVKMKALTTDDFILYENGAVWNNDSAFMNIRRHMPFTVKYTFANFKIHVDSASGDMTYTNHADFVFKVTNKVALDWIESATFRKIAGEWKMNFLQATLRQP